MKKIGIALICAAALALIMVLAAAAIMTANADVIGGADMPTFFFQLSKFRLLTPFSLISSVLGIIFLIMAKQNK